MNVVRYCPVDSTHRWCLPFAAFARRGTTPSSLTKRYCCPRPPFRSVDWKPIAQFDFCAFTAPIPALYVVHEPVNQGGREDSGLKSVPLPVANANVPPLLTVLNEVSMSPELSFSGVVTGPVAGLPGKVVLPKLPDAQVPLPLSTPFNVSSVDANVPEVGDRRMYVTLFVGAGAGTLPPAGQAPRRPASVIGSPP